MASTVAAVRGKRVRRPAHSSANATRNKIVRTSASPTAPADVPVHLLPGDAEQRREEERAGDLHSRPRDQHARRAPRRGRRGRAARGRPAPAASRSARPPATARGAPRAPPWSAATSSGATTTPAPVSRISSAAAPSGGTAARIGPLGGEVLEDLPRQHALAAAVRLRDQEQQRLGVALQRERLAPRDVRDAARAGRRARAPPPTRGRRTRKSPTKRATTSSSPDSASAAQERPRVALAEEAAGVRDPEAVAAAGTRGRRSRRSRRR